MTHTGPMKESEGAFTSTETFTMWCAKCAKGTPHTAQTWESNCGGYEDFKYTCTVCERVHWVDGIDS